MDTRGVGSFVPKLSLNGVSDMGLTAEFGLSVNLLAPDLNDVREPNSKVFRCAVSVVAENLGVCTSDVSPPETKDEEGAT